MKTAVALLVDLVLIVVFVAIGRASHGEDLAVGGLWRTGWPFLVGLLVGWQAARVWQGPLTVVRGVIVWLVCVALGLVLRVAFTAQTAQIGFVIVAMVVTGLFLVGWRVALRALTRTGGRRPVNSARPAR